MTVRFASFNVENLFARPRALNQTTWAEGQPILDAYAEFNSLIEQEVYTPDAQARMIELLLLLEVYRTDDQGAVRRNQVRNPRWAWLRANRGSFDVERVATGIEIVADGRDDWIGWLELAVEPVDEIATRMTARVVADLGADVLAVIEAENRPSLLRFDEDLLASRYAHCMLIDGNDTRGIDVGLFASSQVDIIAMRSNVDTPDPVTGDHLFSRDCAQYQLRMPSGATVWVLVNHFKSQSGGGGGDKRARQAQEVRNIVDRLVAAGERNVVVVGDFNEGPPALDALPASLVPLFEPGGPLVDAYTLPVFDPGPRPGTFQSCGIRNRLDYILLSQDLAPLVVSGGIERHGLWGTPTNVNPPAQWQVYDEITSAEHGASDHAAIFVDLDV
jgi:endonuclease/exonuclease/phosphatase family metal-dependent hydrolase